MKEMWVLDTVGTNLIDILGSFELFTGVPCKVSPWKQDKVPGPPVISYSLQFIVLPFIFRMSYGGGVLEK